MTEERRARASSRCATPPRAASGARRRHLAVAAGQLVGVAGRTGAGKSTLALLAAGFIPRVVRATVEGDATLDGVGTASRRVTTLGRVGIVFATPANQLSASKLTVREELAFGLENLAVPRAEMDARIDATSCAARIAHLAEREPFALVRAASSSVAIASIVAMGTGVLVLDEPTAQLDPAAARIADLLAELAGRDGVCAWSTTRPCWTDGPRRRARVGRRWHSTFRAGRSVGRAPKGCSRPRWSGSRRPPGPIRLAFDEPFVAAALAAHRTRGRPTAPAPRRLLSNGRWSATARRC